MSFTPAVPGSWTHSSLDMDAATHEAGHGVAAVFLRIPLIEVRIDRPEPHLLGCAHVPALMSREGLRRHLAVTMAGPMAVGQRISWPPRPETSGDEQAAGLITEFLALNHAGWRDVEDLTREILRLRDVRLALADVAAALLERGALSGERVRELCALAVDSGLGTHTAHS